ncbi:Clavaminate synthase-like protein [Macroventuria anomochaeta]|uniref:Clavaminate synthase-like protein n=1 Tax=Macroventuria anomochaeta TaxID=301207 RepID=A0ACB6RZ79_9PLEO|nr:Clavaminate synthase-like protein [Macroventuria anomochaeta]KAF2626244.1 Clavaminate synthase-like protein [Macroventuria anomochaeta]
MSPHIDEEVPSSPEPSAIAVSNAAPTLDEIVQLTRHELTTAQESDSIIECGRAALSLLRANPDLSAKFAYQKLHDVPYKEVKTCWRRLYTDATLWRVLNTTEGRVKQACRDGDWIDEAVRLLDMTLILTAAPRREELAELWFAALEEELSARASTGPAPEPLERPAKKLKLDNVTSIPSTFPTVADESLPTLRQPIPRYDNMSLAPFQKKLSSPATHTPLIVENAIQHWPALAERPWNDPNYLLKRTLGGRRVVPIETGRSYTDSGWGQKISTFRDFMSTYMLNSVSSELQRDKHQTGYLAQHDLFAQIPSLRADISIPDFCYCDPAPNPLPHIKATPKLEDPLLNAWFGPKGTISPLHTDPYHNILAQVVGYKYVRLYAPDQTEWLYPRSVDESGVDMSNTSLVDLDEAMEVFPEIGVVKNEGGVATDAGGQNLQRMREDLEEQFPGFGQAKYVEGVLGPGECLYLPPGWWHYVKSLSPSFSVSFWFN